MNIGWTVADAPGRIVLYGHDTMGLGHLRRNLDLAAALRSGPDDPLVLIVTGAAEAGRFRAPGRPA